MITRLTPLEKESTVLHTQIVSKIILCI